MSDGAERTVLCISAGMLAPKKGDHPFARWHLYLNYGLVGLANILASAGYALLVLHGNFESLEGLCRKLTRMGALPTRLPLLLSIPSVFALAWARQFCWQVRRDHPDTQLVVGGRWVVGTDAEWIAKRLGEVELTVFGTAERRILDIVQPSQWHRLPYSSAGGATHAEVPLTVPPTLEMGLVHEGLRYHPSLEVSRGCGMGCAFCAEAGVPLRNMKSPAVCVEELLRHAAFYGDTEFHPYLEASFFRPTREWALEFGERMTAEGLAVGWRAETRVDALGARILAAVANAGLRVIDLGLESASHQQLRAMKKTPAPEVYLNRADSLLRQCADLGISVKVNVLLYAGETRQTVQRTIDWLDTRRAYIAGVSVYPLLVYRFPGGNASLSSLAALGARAVDPKSLDSEGVARLHLSRSMTHDESLAISLEIAREFMTAERYFALKSFSYWPRDITYEAFLRTLDSIEDKTRLPFSTNGAGGASTSLPGKQNPSRITRV